MPVPITEPDWNAKPTTIYGCSRIYRIGPCMVYVRKEYPSTIVVEDSSGEVIISIRFIYSNFVLDGSEFEGVLSFDDCSFYWCRSFGGVNQIEISFIEKGGREYRFCAVRDYRVERMEWSVDINSEIVRF